MGFGGRAWGEQNYGYGYNPAYYKGGGKRKGGRRGRGKGRGQDNAVPPPPPPVKATIKKKTRMTFAERLSLRIKNHNAAQKEKAKQGVVVEEKEKPSGKGSSSVLKVNPDAQTAFMPERRIPTGINVVLSCPFALIGRMIIRTKQVVTDFARADLVEAFALVTVLMDLSAMFLMSYKHRIDNPGRVFRHFPEILPVDDASITAINTAYERGFMSSVNTCFLEFLGDGLTLDNQKVTSFTRQLSQPPVRTGAAFPTQVPPIAANYEAMPMAADEFLCLPPGISFYLIAWYGIGYSWAQVEALLLNLWTAAPPQLYPAAALAGLATLWDAKQRRGAEEFWNLVTAGHTPASLCAAANTWSGWNLGILGDPGLRASLFSVLSDSEGSGKKYPIEMLANLRPGFDSSAMMSIEMRGSVAGALPNHWLEIPRGDQGHWAQTKQEDANYAKAYLFSSIVRPTFIDINMTVPVDHWINRTKVGSAGANETGVLVADRVATQPEEHIRMVRNRYSGAAI